ncbi:hypothetical protein CDAR_39911 [Caerostris darwini]|uniref:Uncharacterized protein n=1 Tax=Caerostris darwini TaxID=1538125 RepID=A0AAV4R9G4_9ARAC|nr:hypothetical protein CDAR_39911 [Caerostris darwini]
MGGTTYKREEKSGQLYVDGAVAVVTHVSSVIEKRVSSCGIRQLLHRESSKMSKFKATSQESGKLKPAKQNAASATYRNGYLR